MSILFKIRAIPCVSNYLDPVVSLNSQRRRKAMEIWKKASVDSCIARAHLGRLFFVSRVNGSLFMSGVQIASAVGWLDCVP